MFQVPPDVSKNKPASCLAPHINSTIMFFIVQEIKQLGFKLYTDLKRVEIT